MHDRFNEYANLYYRIPSEINFFLHLKYFKWKFSSVKLEQLLTKVLW